MHNPGIGRVLVASLHQGIADILPTRLTFYEEWLNAEGLRGGTIGLAPLTAVLSFLRQEGDVYDTITTCAGNYAAEWTVESMSPARRSLINAAPDWLRARILIRLATQLVRDTCHTSRAVSRFRKGTVRISVRDSVFCAVREPVNRPLCRFYAAAFTRLLAMFGFERVAVVASCRGAGGDACLLTIALSDRAASEARAA